MESSTPARFRRPVLWPGIWIPLLLVAAGLLVTGITANIEGKRAIILAARGGQYAGTEFDSQTPHLKTMLGLMGISDVEVVFAEGLNMGDAHRDAAMKEAFQAIDQLVEAL